MSGHTTNPFRAALPLLILLFAYAVHAEVRADQESADGRRGVSGDQLDLPRARHAGVGAHQRGDTRCVRRVRQPPAPARPRAGLRV